MITFITPTNLHLDHSADPLHPADEITRPFLSHAALALGVAPSSIDSGAMSHFDFFDLLGGTGGGTGSGSGAQHTGSLSGCGGACNHASGPHCEAGLQCRNGTCEGGGCGGGRGAGAGGGGTVPAYGSSMATPDLLNQLPAGGPDTLAAPLGTSSGPNMFWIGLAAVAGVIGYFGYQWWKKHHQPQPPARGAAPPAPA